MTQGRVKIALAQYKAVKGNIEENIKAHTRMCSEAARMGIDIIVFPELSLTGYELPLLSDLAVNYNASVINTLSKVAVSNNLSIIAGCPLKSGQSKPYIGAVICYPDEKVDFYHKQYLHQGEDDYCVAGDKNYFLSINQVKIALAVCADFTEPRHYSDAEASNADVYLVSALISKGGFSTDSERLSNIAKKTKLPVLLSNFIGETGGWDTAGRCSVWDKQGSIVAQGDDFQEGLILCSLTNGVISDVLFQPPIPSANSDI